MFRRKGEYKKALIDLNKAIEFESDPSSAVALDVRDKVLKELAQASEGVNTMNARTPNSSGPRR